MSFYAHFITFFFKVTLSLPDATAQVFVNLETSRFYNDNCYIGTVTYVLKRLDAKETATFNVKYVFEDVNIAFTKGGWWIINTRVVTQIGSEVITLIKCIGADNDIRIGSYCVLGAFRCGEREDDYIRCSEPINCNIKIQFISSLCSYIHFSYLYYDTQCEVFVQLSIKFTHTQYHSERPPLTHQSLTLHS